MLKRISAFFLAFVWALLLTACQGAGNDPPHLPETASLPVATQPAAPESDAPIPETEAPDTPSTELEPSAPETPVPDQGTPAPEATVPPSEPPAVDEDGFYHTRDEVALYLHLYGHLPGNYVTKREAQDMGWTGGSVEAYAGEGTAIGGGRFGNYEGLLPEKEGRTYWECDIDTVGKSSRGAKRVVYSNDGLIYYTGDHYSSFELLYGEP